MSVVFFPSKKFNFSEGADAVNCPVLCQSVKFVLESVSAESFLVGETSCFEELILRKKCV